MTFDPFADDVVSEIPDEVPADTNNNVWNTEEKKEKAVVATSEGKVVVTLKGGAGYDAPWIVIHADDIADANSQLNDAELAALINQTKKVATFFGGKPAAQAQQAAPAQAAAPAGNAPVCNHGTMIQRSGTKNGRTWTGYFCPTPKGTPDQCSPKFNK